MAESKPLSFATVKEGDEVPAFVVPNLTRTDLVRYAGASGDFNPIHHDQTFAEAAGNPTVFAHGMLNAGFVSKCVSDFVGSAHPPNIEAARFIEGEVVALNQKGEVAIQGSFVAEVAA